MCPLAKASPLTSAAKKNIHLRFRSSLRMVVPSGTMATDFADKTKDAIPKFRPTIVLQTGRAQVGISLPKRGFLCF